MNTHTAPKQRHVLNPLAILDIWDLPRNDLERASRDQIHSGSECHCVEQELVHDHVDDHDDREQDRENDSYSLRVLRGGLERQNTVEERSGEEMHGKFIRCSKRSAQITMVIQVC